MHTGDYRCIGRKLYRRDQEGIPHRTKCPKCGSDVIFLRNNGGSVWLDGLGWPWPKHPCFDKQPHQSAALPSNGESLPDGKLLFVDFVGRLKSRDGIVVMICPNKQSFRRDPKYMQQFLWVVPCDVNVIERIAEKLRKIAAIVSYKESKFITLDGEAFHFRKHCPDYPQRRVEHDLENGEGI